MIFVLVWVFICIWLFLPTDSFSAGMYIFIFSTYVIFKIYIINILQFLLLIALHGVTAVPTCVCVCVSVFPHWISRHALAINSMCAVCVHVCVTICLLSGAKIWCDMGFQLYILLTNWNVFSVLSSRSYTVFSKIWHRINPTTSRSFKWMIK